MGKRFCQIMDLKDDPQLIEKYRQYHSKEGSWPEIREGIRSVGIEEMEIYLLGNKVVMVVDAPDDFDWDSAMARLATLPRQAEWEAHVAECQQCNEGDTSDQKWHMMERIFHLY